MAADPIWLEKLKRLFGQSRITQERPKFTGFTGYNTEIPGAPGLGLPNLLPQLSPEMMKLAEGSLVDPHLAAAAGGPGWGSGMAPSTMTKVPASGAGGGMNRVLKHLGAMESPELDWSLAARKSGVTSPWSPTNVPYSPVAGLMGFDPKKKKQGYV